ncbi:hypothetical protein K505DRAFT_25599 [Melanomma pulvis-pyrius CBS 109.77]|uniref:Uncharacterized protein n=1 Tax=Melanomma pulvis-pyrius CBS 109.77 TaxID=1314802 RepID=A0A6A6XDK1_9PLEO|nr:hypothetical protein K505DRAFT_25599 [Melanomma pulvis-pyrius CBS 109.77]
MQPTLCMPLCVIITLSHASQTLVIPASNVVHRRQFPTSGWSKEALFALLGVCATVICSALALAWPRLRKCSSGFRTLGGVARPQHMLLSPARRIRKWKRAGSESGLRCGGGEVTDGGDFKDRPGSFFFFFLGFFRLELWQGIASGGFLVLFRWVLVRTVGLGAFVVLAVWSGVL